MPISNCYSLLKRVFFSTVWNCISSGHLPADHGESPAKSWLLHEVGERQKRRKLSQLQSASQKVLWFVETSGLDAESLKLRSHGTGEDF